MSKYAWANPTNGIREQDDSLTRAVGRIQEQLKSPAGRDFHSVTLYEQEPRLKVESTKAYSVAPKSRTRFFDQIRLLFHRKEQETEY